MMSSVATEGKLQQAVSLRGVDPETCMIVFRNHWAQVVKILEKHDPLKNTQAKYGSIPPDEASAVQNYVEHMLFLLIEEQAKDAAMGPILEFVVSENIMEKLFLWSLRREFTDETKLEQLKMYEMLVTQSHQPLLHHKPILKPLMMLLSSCSGTTTPNVEGKLVVLLNQLCSILAKDPSILELFFHTSEDQGAANFLIFSLLIPFIHREGAVGQQARDALLFIMSLSAENTVVAHHIVENTYFCPVLATGLSGLYSSLPTKLEEKGEEWHCLLKDDWLLLPPLVQFMNSLEFCNAVIQVAHPLIRNQLVNYIYNGFLVPVLAPALHKVTVEEVMTTTAYLDLFLRSISEPALLQIFLRFILLHQHENVHILDTLTSRINTPFRLCVVSLALFRTLIGLHCEDVMLQLILRYLIPCNHMMLSQRWAVKERDCYSVSAAKLLALTPICCSSGITLTLGSQERDYILWSQCTQESAGPSEEPEPPPCGPTACIVEYGRALDISYLQYLWEAHTSIVRCERACRVWSARYDGDSPPPPQEPPAHPAPPKDKGHTELEWDDSYDTGMTPGAAAEQPEPPAPPAPAEPPKHIQEMKKSALLLFRGPYIEEADFQDDVMVYRLCAQKDAQDRAAPPSPTSDNGPLPSPRPKADPGEEDWSDPSDRSPKQAQPRQELGSDGAPGWDTELAAPISEAEPQRAPTAMNPEGHSTAQLPTAVNPERHGTAQHPTTINPEGDGTAQHPMAVNPERHGTAQHPTTINPEGDRTAQHPTAVNTEGDSTAQHPTAMNPERHSTAQHPTAVNSEKHSTAQHPMAVNPEGEDLIAQHPTAPPDRDDLIAQYNQIIRELDSVPEGLTEASFSSAEPSMLTAEPGETQGESTAEEEEEGRKVLEEEEDDFDSLIAAPSTPQESLESPFGVRDAAAAMHQPPRTQNTPFTGPFISVVLSKLENMLENSLHVNLLLIGIITQLASYPQPLLRSFLLNTSMVFQPSVRSLYQVLASVKNKIEQFASVERDFPGLLIQAQQYLLFRVDMSDLTPESLTKDSIQEASRAGSAKNLLDAPPKVLQPFLSHQAKVAGAPPSLPLPVRNPMLAAALFPEFLKELAALAQEHSLLCHTLPGCEDACC